MYKQDRFGDDIVVKKRPERDQTDLGADEAMNDTGGSLCQSLTLQATANLRTVNVVKWENSM